VQASTGPEISRSEISRQWAPRVGGKVFSSMYCPSLPHPLSPGNIPGTQFCWRFSRTTGHTAAGRIMSVKSSEIEPATFRLVAQYLELLLRRVSQNSWRDPKNVYKILVRNRERNRQLGIPGHKLEYNINVAPLVIRGRNIHLIKQN